MVLAAAPIRKLHVVGRSRRPAGFSLRKHPVSPSLHRGLSPVGYDFALANGDELVSYTVAKPRHAPVRYYTHSNHLYSVAASTNTSGAVVERYSYNAYGVRSVKNSAGATLAKSAVNQDRGFTGYRLDSETGLHFARARMYSPKTGRFVNRDQLNYISGFSLYSAYFAPGFTDPSGNNTFIFGAIGGLTGAIAGYLTGGVNGAISGAVGGAITGGLIGSGVPPSIAGAVGGAVSGAITNAQNGVPQTSAGGIQTVLTNALISGISAGATSGLTGGGPTSDAITSVVTGAVTGGTQNVVDAVVGGVHDATQDTLRRIEDRNRLIITAPSDPSSCRDYP